MWAPHRDVLGGLNLCIGVLAALVNRVKTGKGEKVDVALVGFRTRSDGKHHHDLPGNGPDPQRIGNRYEITYPFTIPFLAKDGTVIIGTANNKLYDILCDVMGKLN